MKKQPRRKQPRLEDVVGMLQSSARKLKRASICIAGAAEQQKKCAAAWAEISVRLRNAVEEIKRQRRIRRLGGTGSMNPEKTGSKHLAGTQTRVFTYANYVELHGWEFDKFRDMPAITAGDIAGTDSEALLCRLMGFKLQVGE